MPQSNTKKDPLPSQVRLVVEVDGNPVGVLNIDLDRIWPLINHRKKDTPPVEWMDPDRLDSNMRSVVMKGLVSSIEGRLYKTLGEEIVAAQLNAENFTLKVDEAAQVFGRSKADIEKLASESGRTPADFFAFFWEYLVQDREISDLKKEWKAAKDTPPR